jgi:DNA polymerase-3 subunit delta
MPSPAAEHFIADVQRTDTTALRAALAIVADLELASRGGTRGGLSEDTLAIEAIARIAA